MNLQSQVKMAGATYGAGTVAYGSAGTPLTLGGSNFGSSGTVQFIPYVNGSPGAPVQATATSWNSTIIDVTVPPGASSGLVTVTVSGSQSNGLPFIVTSEEYGATCPATPSNNLLQIFTSGLADGAVGQAYSMSLEAGGGKPAYNWSITSGSLPAGINLDSSTGILSGTPTQSVQSLSLTVKVTDASSPTQAASAVLPLTIEPSATPTVVYDYCIGTSNSSCASPGPGYDPAGNLLNYNDSVTGTWSMTDGDGDSGYDSLNRLIGAEATSGPYAGLQAAWNYDSFGNRTFENFSGDLVSQSAPPIPASTWEQYSAKNQVQSSSSGSAPTYDASGNVTQDDQNAYLYDAEGRICAVHDFLNGQMMEYLYDAEGNRVAKGTITSWSCDTTQNGFIVTTSYILDPGGQQLTEMTWSGGAAQFAATNVRAAGELIASYTGSQVALNFQLRDWLGTLRAVTDSGGTVQENCESLPYGNGETCATPPYLFTGKERDTESGNDYFGARYYASSMGGFLSPDHPFVDQHPDNPQSWNLYAYARSNPLVNIDPNGLGCLFDMGSAGNGNWTVGIDNNISSLDCGDQRGTWVPGDINKDDVGVYLNSDGNPMFQVTTNTEGNVYYSTFAGGAQTDEDGTCLNGCQGASIAHAPTDWLSSMFVGGDINKLMSFAANRLEPRRGGDLMALLAGPGFSPDAPDNWAGPGGMGTPQGQGDWAAMVHDYNYACWTGTCAVDKITLLTYVNPFISRAKAKALIQSDNYLMRNAGGAQGVKMGMFFGVVNAFQWLSHPSF